MKEINFKESLGHLFHIIHLKMRKRLDCDIKDFDVTAHQFGILHLLLKNDVMTQKSIADMTFGDEPTTTRVISKLIKKDLAQKQKNPNWILTF